MSKRGDKVKKRTVYVVIVLIAMILLLFFVSKFVIKDFKEFLGFEFGFGDREGRVEKSEVEGGRALMGPGDGIIDAGEECDDGNLINGDGCSASYQIERNWECSGQPSVCSWIPPIGIPKPSFGIEESYRMYDAPVNRNSALTYTQNAEGGYYTHYVDCSAGQTIPGRDGNPLPAGSVVEVHGQCNFDLTSPSDWHGVGTAEQPIFIRGASATDKAVMTGPFDVVGSRYVIIENFDFRDRDGDLSGGATGRFSITDKNGQRYDSNHVALRNSEVHGNLGGGAIGLGGSSTGTIITNITVYSVSIHDNGDVSATFDQDVHGIAIGGGISYIWILDSEIYRNSGDGVQITTGGSELTFPIHHVFIGRVDSWGNKQTGMWSKRTTDVVFSQNIVHDHRPSDSSDGDGMGYQYGPERLWFLFNTIYNNTHGISAKGSLGNDGLNTYFIGNVIYDNINTGIRMWDPATKYILGNTIRGGQIGIGYYQYGGGGMDISNNILADISGNHIYIESSQRAEGSNIFNSLFDQPRRIYWGGGPAPSCVGCLEASPQFINAAGNDFHLQPTSPARNVGNNTIIEQIAATYQQLYGEDIRKDLDRVARPQENVWDIGAYEYVPPARKPIYVDNQLAADCLTGNYNAVTRACDGSNGVAYNTLQEGANNANAGDSVLIRGGTYNERLIPLNSGTAGNYITFSSYNNEEVTLTGSGSAMIELSNRNYIIIRELTVDNAPWLEAQNSNYNIITNNRFLRTPAGGTTGNVRFISSSYNKITDNLIFDGNDNLVLIDSNYNLAKGNNITKGRHSLWSIRCSSWNVIKDNYFSNPDQKIGEVVDCGEDTTAVPNSFNSTKHNIIENNVFADTYSYYATSAGNGIQYAGQDGIIRGNVFYLANVGLGMQRYSDEALYNENNRIYHNIMYDNECAGISLALGQAGNTFRNNILFDNKGWSGDCAGVSPAQILYRGSVGGYVLDNNNIFYQQAGDVVIHEEFGSGNTLNYFQTQYPSNYKNNLELQPQFIDALNFDFRLQSNSPMIDAGALLTKTVGAGSGNVIVVEDAKYFYDGYGIDGEQGDLIQLEGQSQQARILDVDYGTNSLTLDRSLSWSDGQGISLAYSGNSPDIGAYENGTIISQPPSDTTIPDVLITSPLSGEIVSGSVSISATASDNVGVVGVQFRVDGFNIGSEDTIAPYSVSWDSRAVANGTHTLTATARDAAGNTNTSSINVNVQNVVSAPNVLVAAYGLDEGTGTSATDNSGNGNQGTLINGVVWTSGKYGNALDFDGVDDYIRIEDRALLDIAGSGTISAWVRFDGTGWQGIIAKGNANSPTSHNYALELINTNVIECSISNGVSTNSVSSVNAFVTGRYYYIACSWDGSNLQLYIDGILDNSIAQTITPAGNSAPLFIGQYGGDVDRMNGVIDEVRIYNKALTLTEIQNDMNTAINAPSSCIDVDNDGYNTTAGGSCGSVADCNDNNAAINPGAVEVCDGVDNNCVNGIDENNGDCGGGTPYCVSGTCVQCTQSSQCDNGLWCDGLEVCNAGSGCLSGTARCVGGGQVCNEANDRCEPCTLTNAFWNTDSSVENGIVTLTVEGSNCEGKQVDFNVREDDGIDYELAKVQPGVGIFNGGSATTTWTAEWQCDGEDPIFGICIWGLPEYYFITTLAEDSLITRTSNAPDLVVHELSPTCGNNLTQGTEECDDGNADNNDACLNNCVSATCGDGYCNGNEVCGSCGDCGACADVTAPVINNVRNGSVSNASAEIRWNSDEESNTTINYGKTIALEISLLRDSFLLGEQMLLLTGLDNGTVYYYRISACDVAGNCNESEIYDFTTIAGEYTDNSGSVVLLNKPDSGFTSATQVVRFVYIPSDYSLISNCTLFVGSQTRINGSIENNVENSFVLTLENGNYAWNVSCVDSRGNVGISESRNLSVNYQALPAETPSSGGGGGGGGGGISPKPVATNVTNVSVIGEKEKIVLSENLNYIDVGKDKEERVLVDIYGNAYSISFALSGDGRVIARVLNGDYEIPRGDVLQIGVGRIDMYVGVVERSEEGARVAIGLNANAVKEKVEKVEDEGGGGEEGAGGLKGVYYALMGVVGVLIVAIIVLVVWYFRERKRES